MWRRIRRSPKRKEVTLLLFIEQSVDSQIWHLLRSTGLTGWADRSGLYSPSRIRVFVKSLHIILLVKGYVFPVL